MIFSQFSFIYSPESRQEKTESWKIRPVESDEATLRLFGGQRTRIEGFHKELWTGNIIFHNLNVCIYNEINTYYGFIGYDIIGIILYSMI